ncbi:MAG: phage portal protein [Sphaerochaetaceae bacterium]
MIGQYHLNFTGRMTEAQILKAIAVKQAWNADIGVQLAYYLGKNPPILKTDLEDKVSVPFGRKLVKSVIGFMFKEGNITYKYPDDKQELKDRLESVFKCNREQTENVRLGRDQARFGSAFEVLYVDNDDAHPQFRSVHADQVIPVYRQEADPRMAAAVNFYTLDDYERRADVYYPDVIQQFRYVNGGFVMYNERRHYFGDVPVIEYRNNEEGEGDIESVESMIDAYDKLQGVQAGRHGLLVPGGSRHVDSVRGTDVRRTWPGPSRSPHQGQGQRGGPEIRTVVLLHPGERGAARRHGVPCVQPRLPLPARRLPGRRGIPHPVDRGALP